MHYNRHAYEHMESLKAILQLDLYNKLKRLIRRQNTHKVQGAHDVSTKSS